MVPNKTHLVVTGFSAICRKLEGSEGMLIY